MPSESWIPLNEGQLQEWQRLVSDYPGRPYYKFLTNDQIPMTIPPSLKIKINHAVLMASGTPFGEVMLVCNLCRVDHKDKAIDQQPFAIVFDGHNHSQSGVYLNHGDWPDRTTHPPRDFWDAVAKSDLPRYFYPVIPNGSETGSLGSLQTTSHGAAFDEMVRRCRDAGSLRH